MFYISHVKRLIKRSLGRSTLTMLVPLCLILFVGMYIDNIVKTNASLERLSETIEVTGQVSEISGKTQAGLEISTRKVDKILASQHVTKPVYTAQISANFEKGNQVDNPHIFDTTIVGTNTIDAFSAIYKENIKFIDKWDATFLDTNKNVCILEENYAAGYDIQIGQNITLPLYMYQYNDIMGYENVEIGKAELTVIGTFSYDGSSNVKANMIVPVQWLRECVEASDSKFYYDSMKFVVKDPIHLNEFKDEMKEIGFSEVKYNSKERVDGNSLIIYDQFFIENASKMQENLHTFQQFQIPFIMLVVLLIILITFLLLRSRRLDIAISSSLGQPKKMIAFSLFLEVGILNILGCLLGFIILILMTDITVISLLMILLGFILITFIGIGIALKMLFRFDIMQLLTKVD